MKKIVLSLILSLIFSDAAFAGASIPTNWPTAGQVVVSSGPGNYSPTGITPYPKYYLPNLVNLQT